MKLQTTKIAVNLKITEEQNCNIWTNVVYLQTNVQTMEAEVFKNNEFAEVNKAIRTYVDGMDTSKRFKIKSDDLTYTNFFQNKMLIIHSIRQGFPYNLFSLIKEVTPFTESDWAEYLNLSIKTLHRYKKEAAFHFKPIHTEKIIELAEVTNFGKEVFDSIEQFYTWLNTPSYALGNLKPAELLNDSYGKELVMGELNRIDQGIFV